MMPTPTAEEIPLPFSAQSAEDPPPPVSKDWSIPLNISVTDSDSMRPSIAVDSEGHIHVVWSERVNGGAGEIYYKYWNGTEWSIPVNISNSSAFESTNPQVAADNTGRAHIVWEEQDDDYAFDVEILYRRCTGEICTSSINLSGPGWDCGVYLPNFQDWHSEAPTIGIDAADKVIVAWRAFEPGQITLPYSAWLASGTPITRPSGCVPLGSAAPYDREVGSLRIMGGTAGIFKLVFEEERIDRSQEIYYSSYASGWTSLYLAKGRMPDLSVDAANNAHLTWCNANNALRYWNSANLTTETILDVTCNWHSPIAVDASGLPRVFWNQAGQIYESKRLPEGWSEGTNISQSTIGAASPDVVADENEHLHMVWHDLRDGNLEIFYSTTATDCTTDIFEPDDTSSTGSTLSLIAGEYQRHTLCPQSDVDWAKITTNGPSQPNLLVETFDLEPDSIHPNGDTQLTVFDESATNQIGTNQFRGLGPFPGSSDILQSSRVVWHPAAGGEFNIKVFPETPINEQAGSGYSLRLANPFTNVDPVDQASWGPTIVNVPLIWRSGNVIYFTQYFTFDQVQLDALINLDTTFAWEFRRPTVDTDTGIEEDGNVDFGDYWRFMNGVCDGESWTNLPINATDEYSEESNLIPGCEGKNEPGNQDDEEFEIFIKNPSELIADKVYYVIVKFYVHDSYLNNDYQFYISKAEHCLTQYGIFCNVVPGAKSSANLIEGYLQPAP